MDKKTKIFFAVFFTLIAGVVIITFIKYFVAKDYYITAQADCDPTTQKCFVWKCDPSSTVEGEKCTGDATKDTWYYQHVKKMANQIPHCDPDTDDSCKALECDPGMDCQVTYCDADLAKADQAECSDPDEYNKENPPAEESEGGTSETCAQDDKSCVNADDQLDSAVDSDAGNGASGTADDSTSP